MTRTQRPRANWLALEPLEERWLFNAAWPQLELLDTSGPVVAAPIVQQVHVNADSEPRSFSALDEMEADIDPSSLPPLIQQTVNEALAGWQAVGAAIQTDENVTNYVVSAKRSGATVQFKIGLVGELQESEQGLQVAELPNSIQHWASKNFPAAKVAEVVRVADAKGVGYDIRFVLANGQEFEATFQEIDASSPFLLRAPLNEAGSLRAVVELDQQVLTREMNSTSGDTERSVIELSTLPRRLPTRATEAELSVDDDALIFRDGTDIGVADQLEREATVLAGHAVWVTEVWVAEIVAPAVSIVGTIRDWVPFDGEAVERGFSRFLDSLDQLMLTESGEWRGTAYQLVPAISLVIGVQTFALKSLRHKRPDLTRLDER